MKTLIRAFVFALMLFSAILLSGCTEIPDAVQSRYSQPVGEIYGSQTVGQTFVSHENGLSRIDVLLATYARKNTHLVTFRLKESPDAARDIATITINAAKIKDNVFHQFKFAPIIDSKGKSYFFVLESPQSVPGDAITIWHSPDDVYDEGTLHINGQATGGDLAFRTYYGGGWEDIARSIGSDMGRGLALLVLATLLFVLPGYALLVLLSPGEEFDLTQRLILAVGLSVAFFPLALYIATNLGIKLDGVKVAGLLVICGGISCWGLYCTLRRTTGFTFHISRFTFCAPRFTNSVGEPGHFILLAFVFALSLVVRLLMIRGMPYPAWSDSYHHTIISQMIADVGMIPQSYQPYMPVEPFVYHFGFHAVVAFFHWITGMGIPEAVLVVGQVLNTLSVLTIYLLTHYLTKDRWAALISALITGLLSVMPAYYVNWGRYPQLCGQVILPVAAVLTIKCLKTKDNIASQSSLTEAERARLETFVHHVTPLFLAALTVVGLFLAHYRVLLFYILFVGIYLFGELWLARREPGKVGKLWLRALLLAVFSLVIIAPWLRLLIVQFARKVQQAHAQGFKLDPAYNLVTWDIITSMGLRPALLALAALGTLWGFWRRDKYAIVIVVWAISLFILANPHWLRLPGTGLVNNGTVVMALYIPGSILAGFFVNYLRGATLLAEEPALSLLRGLRRRRIGLSWEMFTHHGDYALMVLVILVSLWGAENTLELLTPETFFVTPSDLKAMAWIRENIPHDARFAINTHFWLSYAAIGTDAGYWIPFLTGHSTTVPPMLYSEGTYDYIEKANALARATAGLCETDDTLPILKENGVTHVYIGQRGGCLRPQRLLASPNYEALYHQDGVWVFEVKQ